MLNPSITNSVQYVLSAEFTTGSFTNITDDLVRFNSIRSLVTLGDSPKVGKASLILDNTLKRYTVNNSSSPYYGGFRIGTTVKMQATYQNSTRTLYTGEIHKLKINPVMGSKVVSVDLIDIVGELKHTNVKLPLLTNYNAGSLFTTIASNVGVTNATIDNIPESIPFAGASTIKASTLLKRLITLGQYSFYADGVGTMHLKGRNFTMLETPQSSLNEFFSFNYSQNIKSIKNNITVKSTAKQLDELKKQIGFLPFPEYIPSGTWKNFYIDFVNPYNITETTQAQSVSTPVPVDDWNVTANKDGTGASYASACSLFIGFFADSAVCSLYNASGQDAFLTSFGLHGYSIYSRDNISNTEESSASQTLYGRKDMTLTNEYIRSLSYAKNYGEHLIDLYENPLADISISLNSIYPEVLDTDLTDLLHITENETETIGNYFVKEVEHDITMQQGPEHTISLDIEEQPTFLGYFLLNDATYGELDEVSNKLIF